MPKHKMQPIIKADDGMIRFKENKAVKHLLDAGGIDLNKLSMFYQNGGCSRDDYQQLTQLIGYSVSGYGELSSSPKKLVRKADAIAARMTNES